MNLIKSTSLSPTAIRFSGVGSTPGKSVSSPMIEGTSVPPAVAKLFKAPISRAPVVVPLGSPTKGVALGLKATLMA